jgi:hypothetical protein
MTGTKAHISSRRKPSFLVVSIKEVIMRANVHAYKLGLIELISRTLAP